MDDDGAATGNRGERETNHLKLREGEFEEEGACAARCGQHSALVPWVYL